MEGVRQAQKRYCSTAITVAILAGFLFILAGQEPVGKGLILGTVFSIVNFILMGETLPYRIGKSKGKTFLIAIGSIYFRYIILAIPLIMAIKFDQFDLSSAASFGWDINCFPHNDRTATRRTR